MDIIIIFLTGIMNFMAIALVGAVIGGIWVALYDTFKSNIIRILLLVIILVSIFLMGKATAEEFEQPIVPPFVVLSDLVEQYNTNVAILQKIKGTNINEIIIVRERILYLSGAIDREREILKALNKLLNPVPSIPSITDTPDDKSKGKAK